MKFTELVKTVQSQQRAQQSKSTVLTDIKANQDSNNVYDLPKEDTTINKVSQTAGRVSTEETGRQGGPFNKQSRQVMPTRSSIQRGWTTQRDLDEW